MKPTIAEARERLFEFVSRLIVAAGHPEDPEGNDADLGQRAIRLRHDMKVLLDALSQAEGVRKAAVKLALAYAGTLTVHGHDPDESGALREATAALGMPSDWLSATFLASLKEKK